MSEERGERREGREEKEVEVQWQLKVTKKYLNKFGSACWRESDIILIVAEIIKR